MDAIWRGREREGEKGGEREREREKVFERESKQPKTTPFQTQNVLFIFLFVQTQ